MPVKHSFINGSRMGVHEKQITLDRSDTNNLKASGKLEFRLRPDHCPGLDPNSQRVFYALPPGVPQDRVRAMEAAFLKMLKDPEFLAKAEKV
jgi:hypothetical protein